MFCRTSKQKIWHLLLGYFFTIFVGPGESSSQQMQFIAYNMPVDNLGNCLLYAVLIKYTIYLCKSRFAFLDGVGMVYVFLRQDYLHLGASHLTT